MSRPNWSAAEWTRLIIVTAVMIGWLLARQDGQSFTEIWRVVEPAFIVVILYLRDKGQQ